MRAQVPALLVALMLCAGGSRPALAQQDDHVHHMAAAAQTAAPTAATNEKLPPGEEQSKAALEKSPRHGEWADVKVPGSPQAIRTWVVYPERRDKAPYGEFLLSRLPVKAWRSARTRQV